jgi:hypothetical protein
MKWIHALATLFSEALVCDGVLLVGLAAIVVAAFAEGGFARAAATAMGLSAVIGLGWWFSRATREPPGHFPYAPTEYGTEDAALLLHAVVQFSSFDFDGLSS